MDEQMQDNSNIIIKISKKAKRKSNFFISTVVILFILGYGIFFSSKYWFPGRDEVIAASTLNHIYTWEMRDVSIISWKYSEKQHMMEIQLSITNRAYDGVNDYKFEAVERKNGYLDVKKLVCNEDLIVIRIDNLKGNWSEISLRTIIPNNSEANILKLYTNKYDVAKVENIEDKTENQYMVEELESNILTYQNEINSLEDINEDNSTTIDNCTADIAKLKSKEEFQTEQEIKDTERMISEIQTKIESLNTAIAENNANIDEYNARIEKIQEQMKLYQ